MNMTNPKLFKASAILVLMISIVVILVYAKTFLIPITFGALLSMLLLPITKRFQSKGVNHALSILLSILMLLSLVAVVVFFISWQISDIASSASKIEQQLSIKYQQAQQFIEQQFGISPGKQQQMIQKQQSSSSGKMAGMVTGLLSGVAGFLTDTILVLVYIFLLTYFRSRIKTFILKLVPKEEDANALDTVNGVQQVAQNTWLASR
jgi:predicted PurR-regulated permease PerM